jgi:hypothetical protein
MLNNKFTKLKIFTVSLLLNTNFYGAVSEEGAPGSTGGLIDETKYRDAISIWRSPESSKAQKECAMNQLNEIGISPNDMYNKSAVDCAESEEWKDLARNVVKVRTNSGFGTGTVVSFPGFEGRAVVTCAHCILPEDRDGLGNLSGFNSGLSVECGGQQMLMFSCSCPEGRPYGMFNLRENDPDSYVFVSVSGGLDGEELQVAVERVYLLDEDNMSQDFCVLILKEPMRDDKGIIPGIPFEKLRPINFKIETYELLSKLRRKRIVTPEQPMIIGYGLMGVDDDEKFRKFEDKVSSSLIQEMTGRGLKKAVFLRGLGLGKSGGESGGEEHIMACDGASYYYHGMERLMEKFGPKFMEEIECDMRANIEQGNLYVQANMRECAKLEVEYAKQKIEIMQELLQYEQATIKGFHALRPFDSHSQVGDGFSGGLVLGMPENGNLGVYGLFSGGVFRHEEKCFIENAVQHHMAMQSLQEPTYCYQPAPRRFQPKQDYRQPWQDYLLSARDKHTRRRFRPTEKGLCWITREKNNRSMRRNFRR